MAWVRYAGPDGPQFGVVDGTDVRPVNRSEWIWDALAVEPEDTRLPLAALDLLPIVGEPRSIRDFMSFEEHVSTLRTARGLTVPEVWYQQPVFYFTNPAAVHGPFDSVRISPGSVEFDYELEVAVVIGRDGADIPVNRAADHIAGYVLLCDWSARDLQLREYPASLGPAKGKDSATSLGSRFLTPAEFEAAREGLGGRLPLRATVNGRTLTDTTFGAPYWSFEQMVSYASRGTTVRAGDIIASGTVGTGCLWELRVSAAAAGAPEPAWLVGGDHVRIDAGPLGEIEADILAPNEPQPLGEPTGSAR